MVPGPQFYVLRGRREGGREGGREEGRGREGGERGRNDSYVHVDGRGWGWQCYKYLCVP